MCLLVVARWYSDSLKTVLLSPLRPVMRLCVWAGGARRWAAAIVQKGEVADRFRGLEGKIAELENQADRYRNLIVEQSTRIQALARYHARFPQPAARPVSASVLGFDSTATRKSLLALAGTAHGIRPGAAALYGQALVGRVVAATGSVSRVRLITDPKSRIPVLIMETREQGVLAGAGDGCRLLYLERFSNAKAGHRVLTSGTGRVLPRGIPIGRIVLSERPPGALFRRVSVRPSIDMRRIETVALMPKPRAVEIPTDPDAEK